MLERTAVVGRPPAVATGRRHDIYWLRAVGLAGLFCLHCSRFSGYLSWAAADGALEDLFEGLNVVFGLWVMPLLFVTCGVTAALALRKRSAARFVRERASWLLVPAAFGALVLAPLQTYAGQLVAGRPPGSFPAFYPHYLRAMPMVDGGRGYASTHLWYLLLLFAFCVLVALLSPLLRSRVGRNLHGKAVAAFSRPVMLTSLGLPLVALTLARQPGSPDMLLMSGAPAAEGLLLFVYGYLFLSDARVARAVNEVGPYATLLALLGTPTAAFVCARASQAGVGDRASAAGLVAAVSWCWVLCLLYVGQSYLTRGSKALRRLSAAALPFYVLHQAVIVAVGACLVLTPLPTPARCAALWVVSLAIALAICHVTVRRVAPLSAVFGPRTADLEELSGPSLTAPAH